MSADLRLLCAACDVELHEWCGLDCTCGCHVGNHMPSGWHPHL